MYIEDLYDPDNLEAEKPNVISAPEQNPQEVADSESYKQTFDDRGMTGELPPEPWTFERIRKMYNAGDLSPEEATNLDLKLQLQGNIYDMDEESIDMAYRKGMINSSQHGNWKMKDQMPFWFQVADLGKAAGKAIEDELESNINSGIELLNLVLPKEKNLESLIDPEAEGSDAIDRVHFDIVDEPETLAGGVVKGGLQFTIPFIAASKLLKGSAIVAKLAKSDMIVAAAAKYPKLMSMVGESAHFMAAGAVADYAGFDAYEGRLSDFMSDMGVLPEYLTFMRTNPNNPAPLERLKTALEGAGLGIAVDAVLMGLRGVKSVMHQRWNHQTDKIAIKFKDVYPELHDTVEGYTNEAPRSHRIEGNQIPDAYEGVTMPEKKIVDSRSSQRAEIPAEAPKRPDYPVSPTKIGKIFKKTKDGLDPEFTDNFLEKIEGADGAQDLFATIMDEIPYEKGVQTHAEWDEAGMKFISKIAKKYGGQPKIMAKALLNEFDNISIKDLTKKVRGFDMFAVRYAKEVQQFCKKVGTNGTPEEILRAKEHLVALSEIQDRLYGIRSESGRLLNQYRMARKESRFKISDLDIEESMENIEGFRKVVKKVGESTKAEEILEQSRYLHKGGWANFLLTYSQTAKLWGLATHMRNTVSQTAALVTRLTARGVGSVGHSLLMRDPRHIKAWLSEMAGIGEGWKQAFKGIKKLAPAMKEAKKLDMPFAQYVRENPDIGNFWTAVIGRKPVLDATSKVDATEAVIKARLGKLGTVADTLMKVPFHALVGVDEAFKNVAAYSDYYGKIINEGINLGKKYNELDAYLKEQLKDGRPDLLKESLGAGREVTFQENLGDTSRKLLSFLNTTKIGLGIRALYIPFYSIAINLAKYPMKNSLFGAAAKSVRKDLFAGGVKSWETATKMAFGTGMMYMGWNLHDQGRITGTIHAEDREMYRAAKRLEFSYKTASGKNYSLLSGAPFTTWLLLGANAHAAWDKYQDYKNDPAIDKEADKVLAAIASIPIDYVVGNTWMQGAKDFMKIVTDPKTLTGKTQKIVGRQLEGLMPFGTGNLYDWIRTQFGEESYLYELNKVVDVFRKKVEGFIETDAIIRRDALYGEQIKKEKMAAGFVQQSLEDDPAAQELLRLGHHLTPFYEYVRYSGIPVNINAKQVDEIEEIYSELTDTGDGEGKTLKEFLNDFITTDEYKDIKTDAHKDEELGKIIAKYRRAAVLTWIDQNERIKETIKQKKELKYLGESDIR